MAKRSDSVVVLLAVRPEFAELLMSGEKTVEFRRTEFRVPVDSIVVYASSPTKKVLGTLDVECIEKGSPSAIWKRYGTVGGISRKEFRKYFNGASTAVAIVVRRANPYPKPKPLTELLPSGCAPQSFQYLTQT